MPVTKFYFILSARYLIFTLAVIEKYLFEKMVNEENWASFHQKFSSEEFRRSVDFDRHPTERNGIVGKLVRKMSTRKLSIQEISPPKT